MNSQKLLFSDSRVIATIRIVCLLVSELLAVVTFLVYFGGLQSHLIAPWICWPVGISMAAFGILQGVWGPYTQQKVKFYACVYCLLGALLSIFVLGFTSVIFLGWLLLSIVMGIYLDRQMAIIGLASMFVSAAIWLALQSDDISAEKVSYLIISCFFVAAIVAFISVIWQLTNEALRTVADSHTKQDYEHEQLTSLINSMADGVIAVDAEANIILYNAAALDVLDLNTLTREASLGKFLEPIDQDGKPVDIVALIKKIKLPTINRDMRLKYSDGSLANLYLSVAPVHLGYRRGGTKGFVLMLRDITREKSLEEERDEFISVVSHELRTPIAISEGSVSNAQFISEQTGGSDKIKESLKLAHDQILFLADMINDLATLSRAERGKLTLDIEEINVEDFVGDLAKSYQADAKAKGLAVKTDLDVHLPYLHTGKLYIREVLQNFVTNSIKYTESGSVTIGAKRHEGGVMFEVSDTGIGISKSDQERVFDKFFRSEDFRTRKSNGTGLGLYVTVKLARLLHAEIDIKSQLNRGSTFSIFVPDLRPETPKAKAPAK